MKKGDADAGSLSMSNRTAFEVFELPVTLSLDPVVLDNAYRRAQAQVHPDRFIGKTHLEQRIAATQAMALNDAYQRLKSPLLRAQEILISRNLPIPGDKGQTIQHPVLLMEIMDLRDRLTESSTAEDLVFLKEELQTSIDQIKNTFVTLRGEDMPLVYLRYVYLVKLLEDVSARA